jgi:spore coat polysaccharide biosynthesis predicted glycosyltransferase SpsG
MRSAKIIFFADAGPEVGVGHIFRSNPIFSYLVEWGVKAELWAPMDRDSMRTIGLTNAIAAPSDPNELIAQLRDHIPDIFVVDTYRHLEHFYDLCFSNGIALVVFDDHFRVKKKVSIIINTLPRIGISDFSEDIAREFLLGPKYISLSPEFSKARGSHLVSEGIQRVLVALGGQDTVGNLPKLVEHLSRYFNNDVEICVVGGRQQDIVAPTSSVKLLGWMNQTDLAEFMSGTDLAVIAGGTMLWQAACVGVPSICWPQNDHQKTHVEEWEKKGVTRFLRNLEELPQVLAGISSIDARNELSTMGRFLIDGLGASRIARKLNVLIEDLYAR